MGISGSNKKNAHPTGSKLLYSNSEKFGLSTINTPKNPNAVIITERSVFTDRNVFAKMLYDAGKRCIFYGDKALFAASGQPTFMGRRWLSRHQKHQSERHRISPPSRL